MTRSAGKTSGASFGPLALRSALHTYQLALDSTPDAHRSAWQRNEALTRETLTPGAFFDRCRYVP